MNGSKKIEFYKYQGTGNDFIIIDQSEDQFFLSEEEVARLCHRRFGVGADGLMYIRKSTEADFKMVYYNSDGKISTMCGNGGRCISHLFMELKKIDTGSYICFEAVDGIHRAKRLKDGRISLEMSDVGTWEKDGDHFIIDTGSPHLVEIVNNTDEIEVMERARKIRYAEPYRKEGINVNFLQFLPDGIRVRTYERGVEGETLSCGTGVTACALISGVTGNIGGSHSVRIETKGGTLQVDYKPEEKGFRNIWLTGPAEKVFTGTIKI